MKRDAMLSILLSFMFTFTSGLPAWADLFVVGNDQKLRFDDQGKVVVQTEGQGKDTVQILELKGGKLRIKVTLPLENSIVGPPVNVAVTPDEKLALVANSVTIEKDEKGARFVPTDFIYVIDLTADPPKLVNSVKVGKQPSGLSINAKGDLALVTNRGENSISVLTIKGQEVKEVGRVDMGDSVTHVVFTPDGKRAVAAKFPKHAVALLTVDETNVTYTKRDIPVGLWPYNLDVTPDGKLAITADNGNAGRSDGHVDTVTVIDLEADPPRAIDRVVVGEAPEGFAISPAGNIAVALLLHGTDGPKDAFFYHRQAKAVVLSIKGKTVRKVQEVTLGGIPEGIAFSRDGKYVLIGNFYEKEVLLFRVEGNKLMATKERLDLAGQPAAMRGTPQGAKR